MQADPKDLLQEMATLPENAGKDWRLFQNNDTQLLFMGCLQGCWAGSLGLVFVFDLQVVGLIFLLLLAGLLI